MKKNIIFIIFLFLICLPTVQYKQFSSTHTINHDETDNVVEVNDIFAFRLNLKTDTSEVDDIIVNFVIFNYQTK